MDTETGQVSPKFASHLLSVWFRLIPRLKDTFFYSVSVSSVKSCNIQQPSIICLPNLRQWRVILCLVRRLLLNLHQLTRELYLCCVWGRCWLRDSSGQVTPDCTLKLLLRLLLWTHLATEINLDFLAPKCLFVWIMPWLLTSRQAGGESILFCIVTINPSN